MGGAEAADGCTKWIFLVCNEAASSARRTGRRAGVAEERWLKWAEAATSGMQMFGVGGERRTETLLNT